MIKIYIAFQAGSSTLHLMSVKEKTHFACRSCGVLTPKWAGQCTVCKEWNTLQEESVQKFSTPLSQSNCQEWLTLQDIFQKKDDETTHHQPRLLTDLTEFDRVCGGGMIPGSVILIGGDPGIGKSTLLLQVAASLAEKGKKALYISGEEAIHQLSIRAQRLGLEGSQLALLYTNNADESVYVLENTDIDFVVLDSIQTIASTTFEAPLGSINQMRFVIQELTRVAKKKAIILLLVGHVTKEGHLAGPKLVEHMVDAVFYFEGEPKHQFRILRAVKNRFGPTNEIGVFEMREKGLVGIENPSKLFLADRRDDCIGSSIFAGIEGTRPLLVEIQILLAKSSLALPRRTVSGVDSSKLAMIIAVLETQCNLKLGHFDIYLNIAGGLKIIEPAVDLAIAAAILSSYAKKSIPPGVIFFGEIGLSGAIRPVSAQHIRLKEAQKLGFTRAVIPEVSSEKELFPDSLHIKMIKDLNQLALLLTKS